jgi:hypothetical protein
MCNRKSSPIIKIEGGFFSFPLLLFLRTNGGAHSTRKQYLTIILISRRRIIRFAKICFIRKMPHLFLAVFFFFSILGRSSRSEKLASTTSALSPTDGSHAFAIKQPRCSMFKLARVTGSRGWDYFPMFRLSAVFFSNDQRAETFKSFLFNDVGVLLQFLVQISNFSKIVNL